jgi:osmotically-inducible protein OsmY
MKRFLAAAAAVSAALTYFFDPQNGKRRRKMLSDRAAGFFRRSGRRAERAGRAVASEASGLKQKATHLREQDKPQPDDVTLARKVETELFRPDDVPKGAISVNVNDGVVELRGELPDQAQIDQLGDTARRISGVKDVRNLLHTGANGG